METNVPKKFKSSIFVVLLKLFLPFHDDFVCSRGLL